MVIVTVACFIFIHAQLHRVPVPVESQKQHVCRKSIAFFVHPDSDVCVESLDATQADESPCITESTVSSWPQYNYCTAL